MTRLLFDARALAEPYPTGVTVVAEQFLERLRERVPELSVLTAGDARSNALANIGYGLCLNTVEHTAHAPLDAPIIFFSPNLNFAHTRRDTRRVAVVHDLSFLHAPYWFGPRARLWHIAVSAQKQLRRADTIIAVSHWTAHDVHTTLDVPKEKILTIHPHTPAPVNYIRPRLPFSNEPFFLFLGTLEKRKNIDGIIAAFAVAHTVPALAEHHLVLAGRAGFGAPPTTTLPPYIHHLPYPSEAEKWWLLRNAEALVYPSFFEGFGLPPLEAAAVGCPIISSNVTALPETIGDGALLVSPYDLSQIVIALEAVVVDPLLRLHLTARAEARAAWYSIERQRAAFDSLFPL